ncbi:MAG: zinc-dependent alcohol dehydrogenase family protein [Anaerolineae bacterium]|nr:zinc-dependent alcohol dehydrogenase family protein [Anaerolineae bacterium]
MKAMVLKAPRPVEENPLELTELPLPEPGADEVRIEVLACGVCHTDLHTVEGELPLPSRGARPCAPIVPGHQIVGVVESMGANVSRFRPGQRVGVTWLYSSCGECDYCRRGLENLCDSARFTGLHADGGYAKYMVVPAAYAFPIPPSIPDVQAAPLLCAGVIGYRSLRLCEVGAHGRAPGQRLGLYGFGASAHVTIQVARHWGCQVYVFTRSEEHRQHALELGAEWVGGAEDEPPAPMDASITFAPAGWIVPRALARLRKGGTLAINAIHMSPIPEMDYSLIYGERTVRSVANLTRRDAEELLQLAAEIPIHTDVELYPLEEANAVLQRLKRAEVRGAAVLVHW